MPLPFPNSIIRDKVLKNVAALEKEGEGRAAAIAIAFNEARRVYFSRYPDGALPSFLAYKAGMRTRKHYLSTGAPIKGVTENPVRESSKLARARRLQLAFSGHAPRELIRLELHGAPFAVGFVVGAVIALELTTDDAARCWRLEFDANDRPALIGSDTGAGVAMLGGDWRPAARVLARFDKLSITCIIYETVRDAEHMNYRHPFSAHARPTLKLIDGRNACMSGGSFRFTDRGFIDSRITA